MKSKIITSVRFTGSGHEFKKNIIKNVLKKYKNIFLILLTLLTLSNCTTSDNPEPKGIAYYNFKSEDIPRLLSYTEDQIITFKNQNNDERKFKVYSVSKNYRDLYAVGMGFFSNSAATYFYYDIKEIHFTEFPNGSSFHIQLIRWPLNTELAKSNIYTEYPSKFNASIQYFPWWNGQLINDNWYYGIPIKYDQIKNTLISNGITYTNVLTLTSNNNTVNPSGSLLHPRNVNVLYFDEQNGIIGFDDLEGKQWRIQ